VSCRIRVVHLYSLLTLLPYVYSVEAGGGHASRVQHPSNICGPFNLDLHEQV